MPIVRVAVVLAPTGVEGKETAEGLIESCGIGVGVSVGVGVGVSVEVVSVAIPVEPPPLEGSVNGISGVDIPESLVQNELEM